MESALVPLVAGAVALLLIVSGIVLWVRRSRAATPKHVAAPRPQDDLRSLGIVDIRPMERADAPAERDQHEEAFSETPAGAPEADRIEADRIEADRIEAGGRVPDAETEAQLEGAVDEEEHAASEAIGAAIKTDLAAHAEPIEAEDAVVAKGPALDEEGAHIEANEQPSLDPSPDGDEVLNDDGSALRDGGAVVLNDDARSALETTVSEELGAAIAEVEGASETTPLRPTHAAAFGDVDFVDDYDEPLPIRFPDPREFDNELDLPLPLPGDELDLVRRPTSHALAHLVEAIWSGMRAQTVALLRHDAATLHYKVEALKSDHPAVVFVDEFASAGSALRGIRGQQADLLPMLLKGAALDALGYYSDLSAVGRAYVQPLTEAATPSLLLVVDTAPEAKSYSPAEKTLLRQFASMLAHLAAKEVPAWFEAAPPTRALTDLPAETAPAEAATAVDATLDPTISDEASTEAIADMPAEVEPEHDTPESIAPETTAPETTEPEAVGTEEEAPADDAVEEEAPPGLTGRLNLGGNATDETTLGGGQAHSVPVARRVIVAEEMARSRVKQHPLALALVHHTEAEAVARAGGEAVATTEAVLRQHLDHTLALADGRIEPFGELLYGVFYYGRAADVEAWVELVRTTPASTGETLPLTIGVALYGERHTTSEQLRGDAVQALSDAYDAQVGCVILE
ncbi:MAG: hypothetical protein AAFP18_11160 [Bacteroidota bacterium]